MHFFYELAIFCSAKKWCKDTFFSLHPVSMVIFATATALAFVLLHDARFNFRCYTQCEATPTQKSARKCAATSHDILHERLQSTFTLANLLRWIAQYPALDCLSEWEWCVFRSDLSGGEGDPESRVPPYRWRELHETQKVNNYTLIGLLCLHAAMVKGNLFYFFNHNLMSAKVKQKFEVWIFWAGVKCCDH